MIQQVIDGIVAALHDYFREEYPYFTDNTEQGITPGSFSVICVRPKQTQFLGNRYYREHPMCVYYFPKSTGDYSETNAMIEKLFSILEYITVSGDLVRGTNMNPHVEDGVLAFSVDYNFFVRKVEAEQDNMENLEMRENVNGEET